MSAMWPFPEDEAPAPSPPPTPGAWRTVVARAPGRVNILGDHTDYNGGLALPVAIDLTTEVEFTENDSERLLLYTTYVAGGCDLPLDVPFAPRTLRRIEPSWGWLLGAAAPGACPACGHVETRP